MPKAASRYKHRAVITFKGVSYRYDSTYGEWHLIDKKSAFRNAPLTIREWGHEGGKRWEIGGASGKTPVLALEAWLRSLIRLRTREAKEAEKLGRQLRTEVRQLKTRSWKAPATRR
jgi:hypothetical protein